MTPELLRLTNYDLEGLEDGHGLSNLNLVLSGGDVFSVSTDSFSDAHLLLKGIATLEYPKQGQLFFEGKELDFSDHEKLLSYKKNVGYIGADAALISNRSAHDNLMFMHHYFQDSTATKMSEDVMNLCRLFELEHRIHRRPTQLDAEEIRLFVIIRELSKSPKILVMERPFSSLRAKSTETLKSVLRNWPRKDLVIVFHSDDSAFACDFCNKQILIDSGTLTCLPMVT